MTYKLFKGDMCYALTPYLDFTGFINFCRIFHPHKKLEEIFYRCVAEQNLKEIYHMGIANDMKKIFHECMTQRIDRYLQKLLGDHFERWKFLMAGDHIVLSGSTIVHVLLGENWEGSDLDFFNPMQGEKMKGCTTWRFCQFEDFVYDALEPYVEIWPDNVHPKYSFDAGRKIKHVHSYGLNSKKIQIISIGVNANYDEIEQFVQEGFDLFVLMNTFYYEMDSETGKIVPRLRLYDIDSIMNKTTKKRETRPIHYHRVRVEKYLQRGFKIADP